MLAKAKKEENCPGGNNGYRFGLGKIDVWQGKASSCPVEEYQIYYSYVRGFWKMGSGFRYGN